MQHTTNWILETLQKRLDSLTIKFHNKPQIIQLHTETNRLLKMFKPSIHSDTESAFLIWEEKINSIHTMENEWIYIKGVQDGLELLSLRFLLNEYEEQSHP